MISNDNVEAHAYYDFQCGGRDENKGGIPDDSGRL